MMKFTDEYVEYHEYSDFIRMLKLIYLIIQKWKKNLQFFCDIISPRYTPRNMRIHDWPQTRFLTPTKIEKIENSYISSDLIDF